MSSAWRAASYWAKAASTSWRIANVVTSTRRSAARASAVAAAMFPWFRFRTGSVMLMPARLDAVEGSRDRCHHQVPVQDQGRFGGPADQRLELECGDLGTALEHAAARLQPVHLDQEEAFLQRR